MYTRVEQEDANAAAGEPLAVKAKAYSMPGVTVDGGDPLAVYERGRDGGRARPPGEGPTLVESLVYRLSAHGNIIAPPGVPLHFPEHEAITIFGNAEEYEAAKRGDPVPRFRARLVEDGTLTAEEADAIAEAARQRCRRPSTSGSRARSRPPKRPPSTSTPRRSDAMARELPYIAAIDEAIHEEMERDDTVLYFGQNIATTENDPFLKAFGSDRVRVTPISETAEIGMAVGAAFAGYRPVVELYMAEFMLVAMDQVVNEANRFHYMTAGQVKVPIVLKAGYGFTAGWAGQHTGTIYGMFMGVPGLKVARARDGRRREGPDDRFDPRRQPGRLLPPLPADARARRRARGRVRRAVRRGGGASARAATSRSWRSAGASARRSRPRSSSQPRASAPR